MKNEVRREETKSSILKAATDCFARNGYEGTGVAEICGQAGVSKGAFYYHFDGKESVFLEIIESWLATLERMLDGVAGEDKTIPDIFEEMSAMMKIVFQSGNTPLMLDFWVQATRNEKIRIATIAPYQRYRDIFSALIRRGVEEGSLYPVDAGSVAQALISLASGMFLQGLLDPEGSDWGRVAEDSMAILLKGIKKGE